MSQQHRPTPHQAEALQRIAEFLNGQDPVLVLRGGAGTGKTTLVSSLVRHLEADKRQYALLAPTGRAARILGSKTRGMAETIHKAIYVLTDIEVFEEATASNDPGIRLHFPLKASDPADTVFIVDESSMVGDSESKNDVLQFGSGRLLADLISFARIGRPGRIAERGAKVIFIGDPAQLPPVGETLSPALSTEYLEKTFGLKSATVELTEVLRQKSGSAVLEAATKIREAISAKRFNALEIQPMDDEIAGVSIVDAVTTAYESDRTGESSVLICHSNSKALELNRAVRGRLWGNEKLPAAAGDLLLVNKNSPTTGLMNGDLVRVENISPNHELRRVPIKGMSEPVTLRFRLGTLSLKGDAGSARTIECRVLENLLDSPERELTPIEQRALLVDFRQRNPNLRPKSAEFRMAIRQDTYFNALQVKYGYALTCHKAQGGEWNTAIVDFGDSRGTHNEDFFRWTYTAITRTRHKLLTINAPRFDALSSIQWGATSSRSPGEEEALRGKFIEDVDWNAYEFPLGREKLFDHHRAIRDRLKELGIQIVSIEHLEFRERYHLQYGVERCVIDYHYNGKMDKTKSAPLSVKGLVTPFVSEALSAFDGSPQHPKAMDIVLADPFHEELRAKVSGALSGSGAALIDATSRQYCLRMTLLHDGRESKVDFHHDKTPKWTRVCPVGKFESKPLLEILECVFRQGNSAKA
jgi:hypothetical protein